MKKIFTYCFVAALAVFTGCNKQDVAPVSEGQTIHLTLDATIGADDATKTAMSYNSNYASLESVWSTGDKIYVYNMQTGAAVGTLTQAGTIVNETASASAQYPTSYATFAGDITGDANTTYLFVYQGSGRALTVDGDGLLTYDMGTSTDVAGLNVWDVATAQGKIQGTAAKAYCAASFSNKIAFGYFSTDDINAASTINMNYYSKFTLNVKTGAITGVSGQVAVPGDAVFYMPLVPGTVRMTADRVWESKEGKLGYSSIEQTNSFTAAAGKYYRLGKNNTDTYGPVKFQSTAWTNYETMKNSTFAVSASKNVHFTQGNLQWINTDANDVTAGYWKIADTQYSYLGAGNATGDSAESGSKLNAGNVDLFGWGEVTAPFRCSTINGDYQPSITSANVNLTTDWATKFNGGSPTPLYADYEASQEYPKNGSGDYCVLTKDEWQYLFANQYWGFATVSLTNGGSVNGIVICPSSVNTDAKADALLATHYKSSANQTGKTAAYSENVIDQATIDANGLLFLPAAGVLGGAGAPSGAGTDGSYWSVTASSATNAYYVRFYATFFYSPFSASRSAGRAVRLASVVE